MSWAAPIRANSFDIDQRTGQIKVKAALGYELDHETKNTYTVMVTARDPSDTTSDPSRDSITVTINVIDVNETPVTLDLTGSQ